MHTLKANKNKLSNLVKSSIKETILNQSKKEKIDFDELFNFNSIPEEELESQYMDLSLCLQADMAEGYSE
jgi:hypothetical protein